MKTILGIDPGTTGALSFYDESECLIYDIPTFDIKGRNALDIHKLYKIIAEQKPEMAYLEANVPMPVFGNRTCWSMGRTEGVLIGLLAALNIPYVMVRPAVWKKFFAIPADKDAARQKASQALPQFSHNWERKKDIDRAESALIALYGMYQEKGKINLK